MVKTVSLALLSLLCAPALALAQDVPETEESDPSSADSSEDGDDLDDFDYGLDSGTLRGAEENPDDPNSVFQEEEEPDEEGPADSPRPTGYPTQEIYRPVNLLGGMSEVSFAVPLNFDPVAIAAAVRGDYGITDEIQIGLRYGLGRFADEFAVGKAVALDLQYMFYDNISAQLSLPMYLDPFAMGVVLGVPMRFTFFDTFTLEFGRDLIAFKALDFIPSIENATQNDAFLEQLDANAIVPNYIANVAGSFIYQIDPNSAFDLQLGVRFDDVDTSSNRAVLNLGYQYSTSNTLDVGARIGSNDLASFSESLTITAFTNLRI